MAIQINPMPFNQCRLISIDHSEWMKGFDLAGSCLQCSPWGTVAVANLGSSSGSGVHSISDRAGETRKKVRRCPGAQKKITICDGDGWKIETNKRCTPATHGKTIHIWIVGIQHHVFASYDQDCQDFRLNKWDVNHTLIHETMCDSERSLRNI